MTTYERLAKNDQMTIRDHKNGEGLVWSDTGEQLTEDDENDLKVLLEEGTAVKVETMVADIYRLNTEITPESGQTTSPSVPAAPGWEPPTPSDTSSLTLLGSQGTTYRDTYSPEVLETFENRAGNVIVNIDCPEFTSLCPKTGQPDFARIVIQYIPREKCVESKSLKLYLFSFRNHGAFHEDTVKMIATDLWNLLDPMHLYIRGEFTARGGIRIWPEVCLRAEDASDTEYDSMNPFTHAQRAV